MNIKIEADRIMKACDLFNLNYDNEYRDRLMTDTSRDLLDMAVVVEHTSYPYVVINREEFKILRDYL